MCISRPLEYQFKMVSVSGRSSHQENARIYEKKIRVEILRKIRYTEICTFLKGLFRRKLRPNSDNMRNVVFAEIMFDSFWELFKIILWIYVEYIA